MRKNRQIRFLRNRILKKVVNIMKLTFILLFISFMQVSATLYSQNDRVSIQVKGGLIEDVFRLIERQSNYVFVYNHEQVSRVKKLSLDFKNKSVAEVLDKCLKDSGLYYELLDNTIVIRDLGESGGNEKEVKGRVIRGVVTDSQKGPLPGVSVLIKGTSLGVVTNTEGLYRISLPDNQKDITLIFSFIGMQTKQIKVALQDTINVVLEENLHELDEVVSYGYYQVDKRHMTSSVTSLKMDDIMQPGVSTVDQMLEGRIPGMIFMQNSGQVGAAPRVRIRGNSTVIGNQEPLWVVDGIVQSDPVNVNPAQLNDLDFVNLLGNAISGLNPSDIEQIDVLKDASATALYGTKAANGVIVITTKKGKKEQKVQINYNNNFSWSMASRLPDGVSSDKWIRAMNQANVNNGSGQYFKDEHVQAVDDFIAGRGLSAFYTTDNSITAAGQWAYAGNTDWFDVMYKPSFMQVSAVVQTRRLTTALLVIKDKMVFCNMVRINTNVLICLSTFPLRLQNGWK